MTPHAYAHLSLSAEQTKALADALIRVSATTVLGDHLAGLLRFLGEPRSPPPPLPSSAHCELTENSSKPGVFEGFHACRKPYAPGDRRLFPVAFKAAAMEEESLCPQCVVALTEAAYQYQCAKNALPDRNRRAPNKKRGS